MSDTPDRALLESKERDELLQIAAALGVEVPARARKGTIVSAILAPDGTDASDGAHGAPTAGATGETDLQATLPMGREADGPTVTKRTRTPAPMHTDDAAQQPAVATGAETSRAEDADDATPQREPRNRPDSPTTRPEAQFGDEQQAEAQVAEEGNRRSRRRGRGRDDAPALGETVHCDGFLDLREEGYGFLRTDGPLPSADDVYVAARQVRQHDLRRGDRITGISRPAARSERNPALLRLDTLNGEPPPEQPDRPHFDLLTPVLPSEALSLASEPGVHQLAVIDAIAPVGLGSRGLLTAGGTRSLSPLIATMAAAIGDRHPDVHLLVLLIAERPEDVTEMRRRLETSGEVVASTFDRSPDEHLAVAELTLERTKRMAEDGADVVILFDGLTRLARAYASGSGRHQSADAVAAAVISTLRFFGAGRNLEEAGSITMVATVRTSTGSEVDDLVAARLREAANLEIALDDDAPGIGELAVASGELRLDRGRSFSLGDHR